MLSRISVIVPVYNREHLISRCLDSILNQRIRPYELIVVDNDSSDATFATVKNWMENNVDSGIKFKLLNERKRGACAARQLGLENASGDYLIFFDSDDEMHFDLIEKVTEKISGNGKVDIVCWRCRIHLLDGSKKIPAFMSSNPLEAHLIHTLLRPQGYIVRKDFLIKSGGWTKAVEVWNDYELGLRLLLSDPEFEFIDEVLAEIYSQEDSITGKDYSSKKGTWEKTLIEMEKVTEESRHPLRDKIKKILNYRKAILAAHYFREGNREMASSLLTSTLNDKFLYEKLLLLFSYNYTRHGFRGAWRIVRIFLT